MDEEYRIQTLLGLYPVNPWTGEQELVMEFIARLGGYRVVRVKNIVDIR